ncbi:MAG TPA: VOC family protein [Gemmatimonadales bacterium]|jgi:glyoxalase family protein
MRLDGIHHISCITGDAPANLAFYTGVLGLRLVAKTVNQDDPSVYHLFYADEAGSPGADLTFFEYPGALRGRAGAGMVYRISLRVGSYQSLDFWDRRLSSAAVMTTRHEDRLRFEDPEGLGLELVAISGGDAPLTAHHPEIPAEHALQGFDSVRAFGGRLASTRRLLEDVMGAVRREEFHWELSGPLRHGSIAYDAPPDLGGRSGAGTVHHVAWATEPGDHEAWLDRLHRGGVPSTPIIDRYYFRSIYFREPSGVLFELATKGPGFTVDLPLERLGRELVLPPLLAGRRAEIESHLTPLPDPRDGW